MAWSGECGKDSWWLTVDRGWLGLANCKEGVASSEWGVQG